MGGRKLSDARQVIALAESARELVRVVRAGKFLLDKPTSDHFQRLIVRGETREAAPFRGEGPSP